MEIRPDFAHPANERVLRYFKRGWDGSRPGNLSAPPAVYDLHRNSLGTHPDLADRLWKEIVRKLPDECGWVVYGQPALVRPSSGIIFGFAGGTHTYALRLPADVWKEAALLSPKRVWTYAGGQEFNLDEIGKEWVSGDWFKVAEDWCLAAYEHAGRVR